MAPALNDTLATDTGAAQPLGPTRARRTAQGTHRRSPRTPVRRQDRDLQRLLDFYGVTEFRERAAIQQIASVASTRQWWHQYGDVVADWFSCYLGLESTAETICRYCRSVMA